ncbi:MAG: hypothetical protein BGO77_00215 [Caedibacter sp. 37-49]|nr:MAG: hypothetical protein BGO77_00215 [Caedibacter sp. 37-49]
MIKTVSIGTRVTADVDAELSKIAAMLARPKAWVIEQALKEYLCHEKHFIEAVAQGIEEADQGKLIPHSQVMRELHNKIKN